jgi:FixJ family two-component response regulator
VNTKPVIYIIDDDPSVRRAVKRLLTIAGFKVQPFACPREFKEYLEANKNFCCCMVLDIQMPGMTGIDMLKYMKSSGIAIPVILMTGFEDKRYKRLAKMYDNVVAFLQKPFDDCDILAAVEKAFKE